MLLFTVVFFICSIFSLANTKQAKCTVSKSTKEHIGPAPISKTNILRDKDFFLKFILNSGLDMDLAKTVASQAGLELFRATLATKGSKDNVFISSYSILNAVTTLLLSTKEKSREEIESFLGICGKAEEFINGFAELVVAFELPSLSCANRLFCHTDLRLLPDCQRLSSIAVIDFRQPDAAKDEINGWVSERTRGLVPSLLDSPPDSDTGVFVASAAHFKAAWKCPFEAHSTYPGTFFLTEEETCTCDMMMTKAKKDSGIRTGNSDALHYRLLLLPYESDFSFLILSPFVHGDLASIESKLSWETLKAEMDTLQSAVGFELHLPKFGVEFDADLKGVLTSLGVQSIFERESANLGGMLERPDAFVSKAVHKAVVKVDEAGTEAAAATGFSIAMMCLPPRIVVNSPSLFFIIHSTSKTPIFMGRLARPPAATEK